MCLMSTNYCSFVFRTWGHYETFAKRVTASLLVLPFALSCRRLHCTLCQPFVENSQLVTFSSSSPLLGADTFPRVASGSPRTSSAFWTPCEITRFGLACLTALQVSVTSKACSRSVAGRLRARTERHKFSILFGPSICLASGVRVVTAKAFCTLSSRAAPLPIHK